MNHTENAYCRLCAELKPQCKLTDLETEQIAYQEIVDRLTRLNCQLDFKDIVMPKTVCILCINSLNRAFAFVVGVERAQSALYDLNLTKPLKTENDSSDSENFTYEPPEAKYDVIDIKLEQETETTSFNATSTDNNEHSRKKSEKDVMYLDSNSSDSKNCSYEPPEETYNDYVDIKLELEPDDTSFMRTASEEKIDSKKKTSKDRLSLDSIPLSQLKLTWSDFNWMCTYCETQFPNITELQTHSMEYHKACNAYRCSDCNMKKSHLDSFLTHIRRHRNYLKMSCYRCFVVFPSTHETNKHKTAHVTSDFKCSGCNTNFLSSEDLSNHMSQFYKSVHTRNIPLQPQEDSLTCVICKKKYKTKTSLNTHLLIHTERKRDHTCEVCGKCFFNKHNLEGHLLLHEDKRAFKCEICKAMFRTKSQLRKHVGVHDGEKPFSCEQCGRCFRLQKQLTSHSIIHTDSLPHVCSYCNKRFRFKTLLNQHIRQHTGVKPYSCDICHRDFTNWPNYNKHMKCRHSMDMAKKKHTPDGLYPIDPATGQVIYPEMDKILEWKNKILQHTKPGRPKLRNESDIIKCKEKIKRDVNS